MRNTLKLKTEINQLKKIYFEQQCQCWQHIEIILQKEFNSTKQNPSLIVHSSIVIKEGVYILSSKAKGKASHNKNETHLVDRVLLHPHPVYLQNIKAVKTQNFASWMQQTSFLSPQS